MMRRFVRAATAAVLAVGMMGSTAAIAAPVASGSTVGEAGTGAVTVADAAYPWVCRVFPRLPIC
ncbi:MAG: hypothetical protein ACTJGR_04120 [Pauljensenia sp.]